MRSAFNLRRFGWGVGAAALAGVLVIVGCASVGGRNPFQTLTDLFGASSTTGQTTTGQTGATGTAAQTTFRKTMTVTFANDQPTAELNVSFVAWVNVSSIRSADQQDALFNSGYIQLTRQVDIGTVFSLPPGTFVYGGPGVAGATDIRLPPAQSTGQTQTGGTATITPQTKVFSFITPDVILAFSQPPISCESVAFYFTLNGDIVSEIPVADPTAPFGGATGTGALKTLAQVDVYQCDPFRPGLFLKLGGGARQPNDFFEGENARFDFFVVPDQNGHAAIVTIG